MSGIEILGVVAAVIQIADLGARVSTRLHAFGLRVKNASRTLADVSNNVALTCNILRELGENLKADKDSELCSPTAIETAASVADECKKVFMELESELDDIDGLNGGDDANTTARGDKRWVNRVVGRVKFSMKEPQIDVLLSNLERLKSSMLLMLNVIIYGEQIRSRQSKSIIQQQEQFVQILVQQEADDNSAFANLMRALSEKPNGNHRDDSFGATAYKPNHAEVNLAQIPNDGNISRGPDREQPHEESETEDDDDLKHYYGLMYSLLSEINKAHYELDPRRRRRVRKGVLETHEDEVERFRLTHNAEELSSLFETPLFSIRKTRRPKRSPQPRRRQRSASPVPLRSNYTSRQEVTTTHETSQQTADADASPDAAPHPSDSVEEDKKHITPADWYTETVTQVYHSAPTTVYEVDSSTKSVPVVAYTQEAAAPYTETVEIKPRSRDSRRLSPSQEGYQVPETRSLLPEMREVTLAAPSDEGSLDESENAANIPTGEPADTQGDMSQVRRLVSEWTTLSNEEISSAF